MIIIPEAKEPKFDLSTTVSGEYRELTIEELVKITDYEAKLSNYTKTSTVLDTWPVNGDWKQVIDDKGPIYLKDGNRYHVYCLDADRIDLPAESIHKKDVKGFISNEKSDFSTKLANIELNYFTGWAAKEWLEKNGYEVENIGI